MPRVFIPPLLRPFAGGHESLDLAGQTVGEVILALDQQFPGVKSKLIEGDRLRPGLSIGIGTKMASRGLSSKVSAEDEVHFLPAIGGG